MNTPLLIFRALLFMILLLPLQVSAEQTIKVGLSLPLSGIVAPMGTAFQNGVELFVKENPEEARRLELLYDDHRYDGKQVISSLRNLTEQKGAEIVVMWGNTPTEVAAPVAESTEIPLLAISMSPHGKNRDYVVTLGSPVNKSVVLFKNYFEINRAKNPGAISVNIGDAVKGIENLEEILNTPLTVELVDQESNDFRSLISKFKLKKVDALLMFLLPEQSIAFAKQAKALKYDVPIIGGDIWADDAVIQELEQNMSNVAFVYGAVDKDFIERYRKEYGNTSYIFESASGYEVASILSSLPDSWRSSDLASALKNSEVEISTLPGLNLETTEEFGTHFFANAKIYDRSSAASARR